MLYILCQCWQLSKCTRNKYKSFGNKYKGEFWNLMDWMLAQITYLGTVKYFIYGSVRKEYWNACKFSTSIPIYNVELMKIRVPPAKTFSYLEELKYNCTDPSKICSLQTKQIFAFLMFLTTYSFLTSVWQWPAFNHSQVTSYRE